MHELEDVKILEDVSDVDLVGYCLVRSSVDSSTTGEKFQSFSCATKGIPQVQGGKQWQRFLAHPPGHDGSFSVAQVEELVEALERITDERSRTNRSLEMIRREQVGKRSPQFLPTESKKANLTIGLSA